nr:FG-GAP-like repeat-containing protein [Longibacter salinarum]
MDRRLSYICVLVALSVAWGVSTPIATAQSFSDSLAISTGLTGAVDLHAADIDGDGDQDVLSASRGDNRLVFHRNGDATAGTGDGSSWEEIPVSFFDYTGSDPSASSVFAADIDGDGDQDVVSSFPGEDTIAWYRNGDATSGTGDGSAWTEVIITVNAPAAASVSTTDIDGDGDQDVIWASRLDDKVAFHRNGDASTGAGDGSTWTEVVVTTSAIGAESVFAADMDGDGDQDILSASSGDNTIAMHRNGDATAGTGDGSVWTGVVITASVTAAASVSAADVDGDGDQDVVSVAAGDDTIVMHRNGDATAGAGDGSAWTEVVVTANAAGAECVSTADVDGDGDRDIVSPLDYTDVAVFSNGDGTSGTGDGSSWTASKISESMSSVRCASTTDMDNDGDVDILSTRESSSTDLNMAVLWFENLRIDGSDSPPPPTDVVATAGDGHVDISWSAPIPTTFAGFHVYRSTSSFSDPANAERLTGALIPDDSFTDTDVVNGTTYFYRVTMLETDGSVRLLATEASATPVPSPMDISIEGSRLTLQTAPDVSIGTPQAIETTRYPADQVVLRARVTLDKAFTGSASDIDVKATLNGEVMQTVMRGNIDSDGDNRIDQLPFDHEQTGADSRYADVLLVSSQTFESGAEQLPVRVTAIPASITQDRASESVSLYYARRQGDGRPFDPRIDGYQFPNLTDLTLEEWISEIVITGPGLAGLAFALYKDSRVNDGRCFGMSGTAAVYFADPTKKVFTGPTYEQPESDTKTRQQIADYHLAQSLSDFKFRLGASPNFQTEYDRAKTLITATGITPIIGLEYADGGRHAVLATKITALEQSGDKIIEVHDSNFSGTTYDLIYAQDTVDYTLKSYATGLGAGSNLFQIAKMVSVDPTGIPFFPDSEWFRSTLSDLVDNTGKVYAAAFNPGDSSKRSVMTSSTNAESVHATAKTTPPGVYVIVENEQGDRAGYLGDGTRVSEIAGAVVERVITDSMTGETGTYISVPPGGTYVSRITSSVAGNVRFERAAPNPDSPAEIDYVDSMTFESTSVGEFDERGDKAVMLDTDGDGTVDQAISTESTVLPVELLAFEARAERNQSAILTWRTASEFDNAGFAVERKFGAAAWSEIGFVEGANTTTEPQSYQFTDTKLPYDANRIEYRLRQIDVDGSETLSDAAAIERTTPIELKKTVPNPARESVTLRYAVPDGDKMRLLLYDVLGRKVRTLTHGVGRGRAKKQVDLSGLASGTYFLRLEASGQSITRSLTVVR